MRGQGHMQRLWMASDMKRLPDAKDLSLILDAVKKEAGKSYRDGCGKSG